jgi:hypothetical protein
MTGDPLNGFGSSQRGREGRCVPGLPERHRIRRVGIRSQGDPGTGGADSGHSCVANPIVALANVRTLKAIA